MTRCGTAGQRNTVRSIPTGLWSWSRHPDQFGEIVLWTAVALIAVPAPWLPRRGRGGEQVSMVAPMHREALDEWQHAHTFGQDVRRSGESRTFIVIAITGVMMVIEVTAGLIFGSMALLADGLHMASHAAALTIAAFAYVYARRHAADARFSFGTGKVNALGGFTGAVLLALFALVMAWGSLGRLIDPVEIDFDQAILVAALGLVVNGVSAVILAYGHGVGDDAHAHHHDHNLKSAYLHVMADALTSVLAIVALLAAKYAGLVWMDPVMGVVGAVLVTRWSVGLLRSTAGVLLDREGPEDVRALIAASIESDGDSRVAGLHVWSIGPGVFAVDLTVVADDPAAPDDYRARIPSDLGLAHVSIEVHACPASAACLERVDRR
jgi:cation diffusion facilitator family transporter